MKRVLFIDRDGTLIVEPQDNFQIDSLEKLSFYPKVIRNLYKIRQATDYEFVIVTNQDGLGTPAFPEENFWPAHRKMLETLEGEGITFSNIHIDPSYPEENSPNRKPATGMLKQYMEYPYDMSNSYVIGDRLTDIQLAANLGAKGILVGNPSCTSDFDGLPLTFASDNWDEISHFLLSSGRQTEVIRQTDETNVKLSIDLDGRGERNISTGLGFFDHLLDQLAKHSGIDMKLNANGDLHVDEHHTIEDVALTLGTALQRSLGNKRGIERYGFTLPMDECLCTAAIDLSGRPVLVWEAEFKRERIGDMPTEMFRHFFSSLVYSAGITLHIKAEGENEHHKIEGIFKAFARSLKMAVSRNHNNYEIPSTKGML
ncbi:MAG: bifunctional histidinol-phosphatase/imidazoleglycerol-phosphate dehydratase HisB [Tannerellaceae bacterium]|jgi:imidazoleglycerol-phosphate dehydratase/histidinol-phosphatase|nr:bifunctional histidinol-phosphatase/imidazoleglycerol-phosphate dehydratase HisB [Tannerellaceae bacterium]